MPDPLDPILYSLATLGGIFLVGLMIVGGSWLAAFIQWRRRG